MIKRYSLVTFLAPPDKALIEDDIGEWVKHEDIQNTNPWDNPYLAGWSICGMNHYHIKGVKCLFVSLVKNGKCITEEGPDDGSVWCSLVSQALQISEANDALRAEKYKKLNLLIDKLSSDYHGHDQAIDVLDIISEALE